MKKTEQTGFYISSGVLRDHLSDRLPDFISELSSPWLVQSLRQRKGHLHSSIYRLKEVVFVAFAHLIRADALCSKEVEKGMG